MKRKLKVYIAGKLSDGDNTGRTPGQVVVDYLQNLSAMLKVAGRIRKAGLIPYVPGTDMLIGIANGDWTEDDYRECGIEFLKGCDAMIVISDSLGVRREIEIAERWEIPVYDGRDENKLAAAINNIKRINI